MAGANDTIEYKEGKKMTEKRVSKIFLPLQRNVNEGNELNVPYLSFNT